MTTTPELLSPQEIRQARETGFAKECGETFDAFQRAARKKIITYSGLSTAYLNDPVVYACLQSYLNEDTTLQGSLLLAYRALTNSFHEAVKLLAKHKIGAPEIEIAHHTIESIKPAHVVSLMGLCDVVMRSAIDAEMKFGVPAFVGCRLEIRSANEKVKP